jgi:hypothetical protein
MVVIVSEDLASIYIETIQGHLITPPHTIQHPSVPSGLEYMREALQESYVSICGAATPLGSIRAIDIAIVTPSTAYGYAEGSP